MVVSVCTQEPKKNDPFQHAGKTGPLLKIFDRRVIPQAERVYGILDNTIITQIYVFVHIDSAHIKQFLEVVIVFRNPSFMNVRS